MEQPQCAATLPLHCWGFWHCWPYTTSAHPSKLPYPDLANTMDLLFPLWPLYLAGVLRKRVGALRCPSGCAPGLPPFAYSLLFYNAELVRICDQPRLGISGGAFADDLNILIYSKSTETNCQRLKSTFLECQTWARRHGMVFAPRKLHLMHFTRSRKKFNLSASIRIEDNKLHPETEVKILGLLLVVVNYTYQSLLKIWDVKVMNYKFLNHK